MAKKGESVEINPEDVASVGTELGAPGQGMTQAMLLSRLLSQSDHVEVGSQGGSLPQLQFGAEGDGYVARFTGHSISSHEDEKDRFGIYGFEVIDAQKLAETGEVHVLYPACLIEKAVINDIFGPGGSAEPGDIYAIVYGGKGPAKSGKNAPLLFSTRKLAVKKNGKSKR